MAVAAVQICVSCKLNAAEKKVQEAWLCGECAKVFEGTAVQKVAISLDFEGVRAILMQEIELAKGAIGAVKETFDGLIKELYSQKLITMQRLSSELAELEALVTVYIDSPSQDLNISKLLSSVSSSDFDPHEELKLLRYQSDIEEIRLKLPSIFTFSLSNWLFQGNLDPIPNFVPRIIPIFRKFNTIYFLPGCAASPIPANVQGLQCCTSWLFVTEEHLFICGEARKAIAYIMTISGFAYNPTAPSIYQREYPCLGRFHDNVYLFGGDLNEVPQKYCESYSLSQDQWTPLPNMQFPRSKALPCLYKEEFYLLGGGWTSTAELFSPMKCRFRTLTLELQYHGFNFAVVYDQDIYCFSSGRVLTWEINMGGQYLNEIIDNSQDLTYYQDTGCPVRVGEEVFFFADNRKEKQICLFSFDLSRKSFEVKAKLENWKED